LFVSVPPDAVSIRFNPLSFANTRFPANRSIPTVSVTGAQERPEEEAFSGYAGGINEASSKDAMAAKKPNGREGDDNRRHRLG
jgi:hypothetical protein